MKYILELNGTKQEVELISSDSDLISELTRIAKEHFPLLIEREFNLKMIQSNESVESPRRVVIEISDDSWIIIEEEETVNLLQEICRSAGNVDATNYSVSQHEQIKKDLLVSFQPVYLYIANQLSSGDYSGQSNYLKVLNILKQVHHTVHSFDFTSGYLFRLTADSLSHPSALPFTAQNINEHRTVYQEYLEEYMFEIVATGICRDEMKLKKLMQGNRHYSCKTDQEKWNRGIKKILPSEPSLEPSIQKQPQINLEREFIKLQLQFACGFFAEVWIDIQLLKKKIQKKAKLNNGQMKLDNSRQQKNMLAQDKNATDWFGNIIKIESECEKVIRKRNNQLELLVIHSLNLSVEELAKSVNELLISDNKKQVLLLRLYALRSHKDIEIDQQIRDKYKQMLEQQPPQLLSRLVEKHDKHMSCLCLDGGGIRGVIQLLLLSELEEKTGKQCDEMFDFYAGTSIGGIIALALACGHSAQTLLFKFIGSTKNHIFSSRHYLRYLIGYNPDGSESDFNYSLYDKEGIEHELYDFFHEISLSQLHHNILVTSCEIQENNMIPVVFTKLNDICGKHKIIGIHPSDSIDTSYSDVKLKEIARASSAAYPFFAATVIKGTPFVDGGFLFNNVDILVSNFLLSRGYKKSNVTMLSLGNAPREIASTSNSLEHARTGILGLANCLKGVVNPETYYEEYFAMANLNLDHSLSETQLMLGDNYIRLEPVYDGQEISLDSVSAESISNLKTIGTSWIETLEKNNGFSHICEKILENRVNIQADVIASLQILPRYFSYMSSYKEIDDSIKSCEKDKWQKSLMSFQFKDSQEIIIEPRNVTSTLQSFMWKQTYEVSTLLNRAAAIGHIPSIKLILQDMNPLERKQAILKETLNNWNCLHYASANGEIASFVYLISLLLDTTLLLSEGDVPKRLQKNIDDLQWIQLRHNIKSILEDNKTKNRPYSNFYAPLFNFQKVHTLQLATENNQIHFIKAISLLLQ